MKSKLKINAILILALLFGLAAAWGVTNYLQKVKDDYRISSDFKKVVLASTNIPAKTTITQEMIQIKELPEEYIHESAALDIKDVTGKIATRDIRSGEQVLKDRFSSKGDVKQGLAYIIDEGRRATTIAVDSVSGLSGLLIPGDKVDAWSTIKTDDGVFTRMVVQNILVLAVNEKLFDGENRETVGETPQTVTLAVTPHEARSLILAAEAGSVRLALRAPGDSAKVDLPALRHTSLTQ
ncbi:MAG TPA: Flp pilus assembly protein CpaB [Clostridia bacterium]|nr:Flp pilus assembly protein CpaB [Clostridia bacterium]